MKLNQFLGASPILVVVRRYTQFCLVGATGVVLDMTLIFLLASPTLLGWNLSLSKVIAAEIAVFSNFLWNDIWTFRGLGEPKNRLGTRLVRLGKFNLICLVGIALSTLMLNVQVYWLHMNVYLSNFTSIVLASIWNFLMNMKLSWRTVPSKESVTIPSGEERISDIQPSIDG